MRTPDLHASNKAKLSQTLNPVTEGLTFAAMAMGLRVCPINYDIHSPFAQIAKGHKPFMWRKLT